MRHPLVLSLAAAGVVLGAAVALPLVHMGSGPAPSSDSADLPWAATPLPDGSLRVLGLHIGGETLGDVASRLGDELQVALVARHGETGALEALIDPYRAGFVSGRLVLAFAVDAGALQGWRERSPRSEAMEGGARRFVLDRADRALANRARLVGASFVPTARLAAEDVEGRFGPPAGRQALAGGAVALGYPGIGLVATVGGGQRGVLEFVAPRDVRRSPAGGASR